MTQPAFDNTADIVAKWNAIADDVEETQPGAPVTVLTGEALDLSHFIDKHWEPVSGKKGRPGMKSALSSGLLTENTSTELRELVVAVSFAHSQYRAVNAATLEAPVDRGEFLLSEIRQCLQFLFDDGVDDEQDAELARLSESHSDTSSHDALALSLEGFAYYAQRHRDALAELPEFDPNLLDEALVVANRLREQSSLKLSNDERERQRAELALRNRLIALMAERVRVTRRAARFVFRHYPHVAQLAGSSYERRRRRRRSSAQEVSATDTATA